MGKKKNEAKRKGRIVFWAQVDQKINIWFIYHTYLSSRPRQGMKIKMKDIVFH